MSGSFLEPYSNEYKLTNGFDVGTCQVSGNHATNDAKTCCGSYPNRYLFNNQLGMRGCCGDMLFDVTQMSCCADQTLAFGPCGVSGCC